MSIYVIDVHKSPYTRLIPVPLNSVRVLDEFWRPRLINLSNTALVHQFRMLEETGRLDNFRVAAGKRSGSYRGLWFNDSDVYKVIEASAYALVHRNNEELHRLVMSAIRDVVDAQEPDGYLNTFIKLSKHERWVNLAWSHELYCAGHMFQAAVATRRALNDQLLFNAALRFADLIANTFGWGKLEAADGHPEVEMALIELYRETGRKEYLETAKFFIDFRGRGRIPSLSRGGPSLSAVYLVDHENVRRMEDFAGSHAVRALYLFAGATDLYLETGEEELLNALRRLWMRTKAKMYITGGLGSRHEGEAFGEDFELPNDRAYSETCASVAGIMWAWRMFLATGEADYMDTLERILYNAALAGISLDGTRYFYVNPLADYQGKHERQPWYECACCPPNIARLIAYVPGMIYAVSRDEPKIWVNLYVGSRATINLHGVDVEVAMNTRYPWSGDVEVEVRPSRREEFSVMLRIPKWARGARIRIGDSLLEPRPGEYFEIRRTWDMGDRVKLQLPMEPRLVEAHPWVEADYGKVAIVRGPIVYAVEEVDNGFDPRNLAINPANTALTHEYVGNLLGGVVVVKGEGYLLDASNWGNETYRDYEDKKMLSKVQFKAIPYYAWNNRGKTRMSVWIKILGH